MQGSFIFLSLSPKAIALMFSFANWDCLLCQVMIAYCEEQTWMAWAQGHMEAPETQAQPCPPGAQAL